MSALLRFFYALYSICIATPLFVVATIVTAIIVVTAAALGDDKFIAYWAPHYWSRFTCFIYLIRVKVTGQEKLDSQQSYVFLANHQGYFDIFLIYGYLGHNLKWMMKEYLKKLPFVGYACMKSKQVFVGNTLASIQETVRLAQQTLREGMSLVIFPEGTRTYDGKMQPFKKGAFTLANEIGLPIVPMTINGSFHVFNRKAKMVHFGQLSLTVHDPITAEERKGQPTKKIMEKAYDIINSDLKTD